MALPKPPPSTPPPPHLHQIAMKTTSSASGGAKDVRQRANLYMSKLADRDTEAMAASQLESMARDLPADSLPCFLSAISDARPSDKTPLRRHSFRLLSLLSRARPPQSIAPLLPRMLAAALRGVRDPDSSVRAACVDAVRDMARGASAASFGAVFLRPLSESLVLEQDGNAQAGSAMCLAAAIDETSAAASDGSRGGDLTQHLHRLVPRLVKLAKSDGFKAKPALLALLGSVVAAGGASTSAPLGIVVPCLADALASDDWSARKAAAEALARVAAIPDADLLAGFKSSYFLYFRARRYDKVKIVRDSMNQMLEAWQDVPGALGDEDGGRGGNMQPSQPRSISVQKENVSDGQPIASATKSTSGQSTTPLTSRKNRSPGSRSSPTGAFSTHARRRTPPSTEKRMNQPMFHKVDHKKPSDWKVEIAIPQAPPSTTVDAVGPRNDEEKDRRVENCGSKPEVKRLLFGGSEGRMNKFGGLKSGPRMIPVQEQGSPGDTVESGEVLAENKDSDLYAIRKQLAQIENQQSRTLDLLQSFIGNSQSGICALETRVHGLEVAMDELCHDLTVFGRIQTADPTVHCCKIPGAEFLSSKLWKRAEGRYSSRFSNSASAPKGRVQNSDDKAIVDSLNGRKWKFVRKGGFVVNPLAEINSQSRSSDVSPKRMPKNIMHDQRTQDSSRIDGMFSMTTATATMIKSS